MTDRELLELAAKAAGIRLHVWGTPGIENFADLDAERFGSLWKPLTNDGDALRLAVKLWIEPDFRMGTVRCFGESSCFIEPTGDDPYAATRRAIVRAAAEIGKQIEGGQHVE